MNHDLFTLENGLVLCGMIYSICLHEAAHAYVSDWLGDDTPRRLGKVTLNPIAHIQTAPIFTLILPVISFIAYNGGGIIGGGLCPVNPYKLRHPRRDEFLVAGAGPGMNFLLCALCTLGMMLPMGRGAHGVLFLLALNNLMLGVFNLIPIPPMDGSIMLAGLIPALRPLFRQVGAQGFLLVYFVGGMIMNQIFPPLFHGYLQVLRDLGIL